MRDKPHVIGNTKSMNAPAPVPQAHAMWPGYHFLRHLLAVIILAFHSYVLTFGGNGNIGYAKGNLLATAGHLTTKQVVIEALRPGLFALTAMFFALSGFLVAGSALRTRSTRQFFTLRALRILPALCTEVALSAFILGPLVTTLPPADYFGNAQTYSYFGNIVGNIQYELPGVFTHNPLPDIVNVNLWTLHAEFGCYLLIGLLMMSGLLYKKTAVSLLIVACVIAAAIVSAIPALGLPARYEATHFQSWFLVVMFALGMLFALHAAAIPLNATLCALSGAGYFGLMIFGICDALAAVLLTYVMLYLGACRFGWFDRLVKDDCSYGIYLYGYPITQAVIFAFGERLSVLPAASRLVVVATLSISVTFAFALFSWRTIEKPFLKLKTILLPARPATRTVGFAAIESAPRI